MNSSIYFTLIVTFTMLAGCHTRSRTLIPDPEITHAVSRPPAVDLDRLKYLFEQRGGFLYNTDSQNSVLWRDYEWFRIFDFDGYSVIVYPYNWTYHQYNVLIYAGELPRSEYLINDAHAVPIGGPNDRRNINGFPKLNLNANTLHNRRVGMDHSYLGQTCQQYVDTFSTTPDNFSAQFRTADELHDAYAKTLAATANTVSFSRIQFSGNTVIPQRASQHVIYENGLVVYVSYVSPNDRGPMLPAMAINKPQTIVIDEGVIELSQFEDTTTHD